MAFVSSIHRQGFLCTGRSAHSSSSQQLASIRAPASSLPRLQRLKRRQLLASGALLFGWVPQQHRLAQAATSVFEEITVELNDDVGSDDEDFEDPPTFVTATGRIVAVGDLHGDLAKALRSLQLARVMALDEDGEAVWMGGDTVVVQLGDVLDRGDAEIAIIRLLRCLDEQARRQGGAVYMLNGNHESLNVCGDFRYVAPGAMLESAMELGMSRQEVMEAWNQAAVRARARLFLPGGAIARELARNPTVLVVNDTAFAHGGLLPTHVNYGLERMNREVAAWMRKTPLPDGNGFATPPFLAMGDGNSVMWNRSLSREHWTNPVEKFHGCNAVSQALARVGAKRLVVGHTPQLRGINCECDGKVWRVDVGMSAGVLGAPAGILEIVKQPEGGHNGDGVECRVLTEDALRSYDEADVAFEL